MTDLREVGLGGPMTTIALFHSVLGVRQGVLDVAGRLRQDGEGYSSRLSSAAICQGLPGSDLSAI